MRKLVALVALVAASFAAGTPAAAQEVPGGGITGLITDLSGPTALIESETSVESGSEKAYVEITTQTQIYRQYVHETVPASLEDLEVGQQVVATFVGPVAESYPVQATAGTITIIKDPSVPADSSPAPGTGAQYDAAPAASCSGYAGYGASAAPYQYCPGYGDPNGPPRGGAGGYPPAQYPPPGGPPTDVIADLDGDGQPESSVTVADADGDGVVDEEDVSAVVGDVFFVYAADDSTIPANDGGTPTAAPIGESDDISSETGENEGGGETNGRTKSEGEGEELGQGGRDHGGESDARETTDDPDGETVADAERTLSGRTGPGPGRVVIFAIGAGTLLVANGLLARWIVG